MVEKLSTIPAGFSPAAGFLRGRTILITGATGGIGEALVTACAGYGAVMIIAGRRVAALESLSDRVMAAGHPQPVIYPVNLQGAAAGDYAAMAEAIGEQFTCLDAVVHTAAEFAGLTPLAHTDPAAWSAALQVNLTAAFLLNQAVLGLLQGSDRARILFTLDDEELGSSAYWGAYGVSKWGLRALTRILASELEVYGIEVNAVVPPPLDTRLRARAYLGDGGAAPALPQTVVNAYLYLLSDHRTLLSGRLFTGAGASESARPAPPD